MKYLRYLLFVVLLNLPLYVNALEAKPVISCDKSMLLANESANCILKLEITSGGVKEFDTNLVTTNDLQISDIDVLEAETFDTSGSNIYVNYSEVKTGTISVASFVVTASNVLPGNTETVTLRDIQVLDELDEIKNYEDLSYEFKIPNDNALLSSLTVDVGNLSPEFNPEVTNYSLIVDSETINIQATGNANASISGTGVKNLAYGANTFQIIVKAESGNIKTYTITVTRKNNKSSDSSLKSLEVNNVTLDFNANVKEYKDIVLPSNVDTFTVRATTNDSKASIKYSSNDIKLELDETDTIYIYVTAENGSMSTYRVTATRKDDRSSNNNLKSLTLNGKSINLTSGQSFTTTVDNAVTSVNVEAVVQDSKANFKINGNSNLIVGNNVFEIVVTAENGAIKTYKLTVIRKNNNGDITNLSNNSSLKNLEIKGLDIRFQKNKLQYNFEVENEINKLQISYILDDTKASVTVEGNDNLKVGINIVKIIVTAENGESSTYVLNVTRKEKDYLVENDTTKIINALKDKEKYEEVIVNVKSDDNLLIPNNIISNIITSKKKITYKVISGTNMLYSVILNGNLFNSYSKDFSYGLVFESANKAFVNKIGTRKNLILSFKHTGDIPTGTMYNIYVGNTFSDNSSTYLYSYNNEKNELTLEQENLKVTGGYVTITFNNLKEFVLLNSKVIDGTIVDDKQDNVANDDSMNNTGVSNWLIYVIAGGSVLLIVLFILIFINKKKKREPNASKKKEITNLSTPSESVSDISIPGTISTIPVTNDFNDEIDLIDIDISQPITNTNNFLLGISVMDINDYLMKCPLADLKNSNIKEGIVIVGFDNNSSIQKIGMIQGDVLLEINGQKILNKEHFKTLVSNISHGMEVTFTFYRNGETKQIKVVL